MPVDSTVDTKPDNLPLTDLQQAFVTAYIANAGDAAKAALSAGCSKAIAYRWLQTHPAIMHAIRGIRRWQVGKDDVLLVLWRIARKPARLTKETYHSQVAALELIARIEGWIHEPAPSQATTNVVVGSSTADPSRYADAANAAAALAGDAMPAFAEAAAAKPALPPAPADPTKGPNAKDESME